MTPRIVVEAFRQQSLACAELGSPFMSRLMALFADRLRPGGAVADHVLNWAGDPRPDADNVPLRLAGALHALKLQGKALEGVYPPNEVDDEALWQAVEQAIETHRRQILDWLSEAPQTNEVRRSGAILPALALAHRLFPATYDLVELGTSGGLNLRAEKFVLHGPWGAIGERGAQVTLEPEWIGSPPPLDLPRVEKRLGVDLNPLDPADPKDRLRLLAYLWPDQSDRIQRTRSAIQIAASVPARISREDAGSWLRDILATPSNGKGRFVFHTVAAQYFPEATKADVKNAFEGAGIRATEESPLVHFAMEADEVDRGAGLTMTVWPGGKKRHIGRADFHGRWIEWTDG